MMNSNRIIIFLSAIVILFAGIIIGQYFQINEQSTSVEVLKTEILAELQKTSEVPGLPLEKPEPQRTKKGTQSARNIIPFSPPKSPEAISDTQYWISKDYSDEKPFGYSAWAELVEGGHLILEKCLAPDYSNIQITAENPPQKIPECTLQIDTKIAVINETEVVLSGGQKLPIKLEQKGDIRKLTLIIEDVGVVLEPGSKNDLWQGLTTLPSVKLAYQAAWKAHSQKFDDKKNINKKVPQ